MPAAFVAFLTGIASFFPGGFPFSGIFLQPSLHERPRYLQNRVIKSWNYPIWKIKKSV